MFDMTAVTLFREEGAASHMLRESVHAADLVT